MGNKCCTSVITLQNYGSGSANLQFMMLVSGFLQVWIISVMMLSSWWVGNLVPTGDSAGGSLHQFWWLSSLCMPWLPWNQKLIKINLSQHLPMVSGFKTPI